VDLVVDHPRDVVVVQDVSPPGLDVGRFGHAGADQGVVGKLPEPPCLSDAASMPELGLGPRSQG